mmetsp:Transcript_32249/g.81210  ORF Transcript_32249/g.81210 Transcript_32249/m.81210 type:complete len:202 (-) Transcript_32249:100-705(-)
MSYFCRLKSTSCTTFCIRFSSVSQKLSFVLTRGSLSLLTLTRMSPAAAMHSPIDRPPFGDAVSWIPISLRRRASSCSVSRSVCCCLAYCLVRRLSSAVFFFRFSNCARLLWVSLSFSSRVWLTLSVSHAEAPRTERSRDLVPSHAEESVEEPAPVREFHTAFVDSMAASVVCNAALPLEAGSCNVFVATGAHFRRAIPVLR